MPTATSEHSIHVTPATTRTALRKVQHWLSDIEHDVAEGATELELHFGHRVVHPDDKEAAPAALSSTGGTTPTLGIVTTPPAEPKPPI